VDLDNRRTNVSLTSPVTPSTLPSHLPPHTTATFYLQHVCGTRLRAHALFSHRATHTLHGFTHFSATTHRRTCARTPHHAHAAPRCLPAAAHCPRSLPCFTTRATPYSAHAPSLYARHPRHTHTPAHTPYRVHLYHAICLRRIRTPHHSSTHCRAHAHTCRALPARYTPPTPRTHATCTRATHTHTHARYLPAPASYLPHRTTPGYRIPLPLPAHPHTAASHTRIFTTAHLATRCRLLSGGGGGRAGGSAGIAPRDELNATFGWLPGR